MAAHLRQYDDSGRPIRDRFRAVVLERLESNLCADLLVLAIRRFHEVKIYLKIFFLLLCGDAKRMINILLHI